MCGIAGAISNDVNQYQNIIKLVNEIVTDQHQRGPDFQQVIAERTQNSMVVLGHNRLAIIDQKQQANQPMWDFSKRFCISYNGMIYNYQKIRQELLTLGYQFNTDSDTEVVLTAFAEWREDCLSKFNGMFAFALYDKNAAEVFLCRDRFGIKPLFYKTHKGLVFASSARVMAQHFSLALNYEYISRGLCHGIYEDNSDITQYTALKMLPPSSFLKYSLNTGNFAIKKYYELHDNITVRQEKLSGLHGSEIIAMTGDMLETSVMQRLRSDVPLGISLSGGLDSATITAYAAKHHPDLTGICYGDPNDKYSEGSLVKKLGNYVDIKLNYINLSNVDITQAFDKTLSDQDAPFTSLSVVAQNLVYQRARELGLKVLLSGQGGDEAFMGYRKYFYFYSQLLKRHKQYHQLILYLLTLLPMLFAELPKAKLYWENRNNYTKNKMCNGLLKHEIENRLDLRLNPNDADLTTRQVDDIVKYSIPTLLRYEDRNAMGNSIEGRLPFMDYNLLELALALPVSFKLNQGYGKWIVRQVSKGLIPDAIRLAKYKRGFDVNHSQWVINGLGQHIRARLAMKHDHIQEICARRLSIASDFSDERLINDRMRFKEAISLIWIATKI